MAKRRGRPPGSKNKKAATAMTGGKRGPGRPPGSKNRAKRGPGSPPKAVAGGGSMKDAILEQVAAANGQDVAVADLIAKLKSRTSSNKPGTIISLALMALKKAKLVESTGRGRYKLTAKGT